MKDLINAMKNSYEEYPLVNMDSLLPNRKAVIKILNVLHELIFLPHKSQMEINDTNLDEFLQQKIFFVQEELTKQICLSISYTGRSHCSEEIGKQAKDLTEQFLALLPEIRHKLYCDIDAIYLGDPACSFKEEIMLAYPGFYAVFIYRIAHELHRLNIQLIPRLLSEYAHTTTGIDIHPGAEIGESFMIDHGTGVVIGETAVIGNHVKIYQGVTLGALTTSGGQSLRGVRRHPTILNHVVIYSNASILGGETIVGEGSVIGANVFVTKSIPPYSRVTVKGITSLKES